MEPPLSAYLRPIASLPAFSVRRVEDEVKGASLCGLHAHVMIESLEPDARGSVDSCELRMEVDPDELAGVDVTTLRLFALERVEDDDHPSGYRFTLIERSGFDPTTGEVWAEIDASGRYGAYALPADPRVRFAVEQLRASYPVIRRGLLDGDTTIRDRICHYILCTGPHRGDVPDGLCERCLGLELPRFGLPEFSLLDREVLLPRIDFGFDPQPSCLLVDGPIVYRDSVGDLVAIKSPGSSPVAVVSVPPGASVVSFEADPLGTRIAFITEHPASPKVWTVSTCAIDGSGLDDVLTSGEPLRSVTWGPIVGGDHTLGFIVQRARGSDLDVMNADGSGRETLLASPLPFGNRRLVDIREPRWSPDGGQLAFIATLEDPMLPMPWLGEPLLVAQGDGTKVQAAPLGPFFIAHAPVFWLPTGDGVGCQLSYSQSLVGEAAVYRVLPSGITGGSHPLGLPSGYGATTEWLSIAPRGSRLVASIPSVGAPHDLYVADLTVRWTATTPVQVQSLSRINHQGYHPHWAPACAI